MEQAALKGLPGAFNVGRQARAQLQQRAAIRAALIEGMYAAAAVRLGSTAPIADRFKGYVTRLIRQVGPPPSGIGAKVMAFFRGGPATLFDGPEARKWEDRVFALGREAFLNIQLDNRADPVLHDWQKEVDLPGDKFARADEFARLYLEEVERHLAERSGDDSPEAAILAAQARADAEERYRLLWTPSRFRVTKYAVSAAFGAVLGHVVNVDVPSAIPDPSDWVETAFGSILAGGAVA
jgi:hypothetical protein